ncbi:MAG: AraC family ligand binding domain-containing protein, partial [Planctomycetota bacterium]
MRRVSFFRHADLLHPALGQLGYASTAAAVPDRLGPHDHGSLHEICTIERGIAHWWVEDEIHHVDAGHCYLTRPGERHGGLGAVFGPFTIRWLVVDLAPRGVPAWDAAAKRLRELPVRTCPVGATAQDLLARLLREHQAPGPLAGALVEALLVQCFIAIVRDADSAPPQRISPPI